MTNEELIKKVRRDYEVVLEVFRVYESSKALLEAEKENLSRYAVETNGAELGEETNVFTVGDQWIYAAEWYDAEWDD